MAHLVLKLASLGLSMQCVCAMTDVSDRYELLASFEHHDGRLKRFGPMPCMIPCCVVRMLG